MRCRELPRRHAFIESQFSVNTRDSNARRAALAATLTFWLLILLTLTMLALRFGAWSTELKFAGPFSAEAGAQQRSLILLLPKEDSVSWWRQPLIGNPTLRK
jgi:hypothetical protein